MKALLQLLLFAAVILAVAFAAKGIAPVFPALAAMLRAAIHPLGIVALGGLLLLVRIGRRRRPSPHGPRLIPAARPTEEDP